MRKFIGKTLISVVLAVSGCVESDKPYQIQEQQRHPYENELRPGNLPYELRKPDEEETPNNTIPKPPKINKLRAMYANIDFSRDSSL